MEAWRKWHNACPRKSGWYWVDTNDDRYLSIFMVEGRDAKDDGWIWFTDGARWFLTPGARCECGDEKQSEEWMTWKWAGPIPCPDLCERMPDVLPDILPAASPGGCSEG